MYRLFDRDYRIRIDTIEVSELDCAFDITRTVKRQPNTSSIRIYNLSSEHQRQIENLSLKEKNGTTTVRTGGKIRVEIEAGYVGSRSLIFRGDLRFAETKQEGPDFVTEIEGDDGGRSVLGASVSRSFPAGTSVATVVRACASALGVGTGNLADLEATLRTEAGATFTGGTTLFGPADKELDRVLRSCGLRYSIQSGNLQITRPNRPLQVQAVLLTSNEIERPTANPDGTIQVVAPILPELYPGGRVQLETSNKRGLFGILEANYVGDTSADAQDWHVNLKLKP
jgi:hypothetical protein